MLGWVEPPGQPVRRKGRKGGGKKEKKSYPPLSSLVIPLSVREYGVGGGERRKRKKRML